MNKQYFTLDRPLDSPRKVNEISLKELMEDFYAQEPPSTVCDVFFLVWLDFSCRAPSLQLDRFLYNQSSL